MIKTKKAFIKAEIEIIRFDEQVDIITTSMATNVKRPPDANGMTNRFLNTNNKFEGMLKLLSAPIETSRNWVLGPNYRSNETDNLSDEIILGYSIEAHRFLLMGNNSHGKHECAGWTNVDKTRGIMTLFNVAYTWKETMDYIKPYKLLLILHQHEQAGKDDVYVTNEKEAKAFVDYYGHWYKTQTHK